MSCVFKGKEISISKMVIICMSKNDEGTRIEINANYDDSRDGESITELNDEFPAETTLVGTVHISPESKNKVEQVISEKQPDIVGIELDEERLYDMLNKNSQVIGGDMNSGFNFGELLRKYQEVQIAGTDMLEPGKADMLPAVSKAIEHNLTVGLIDMSKQELKNNLLENAYDSEGDLDLEIVNKIQNGEFSEIYESVSNLISSRKKMLENTDELDMSEIVKNMENSSKDEIKAQFEPLRDIAPEFVEALIDERDKNMAGHIHWLRQNGYSSVCIMGFGHLSGVEDYLQNPSDIPSSYVRKPEWYSYKRINLES